MRISRSFLAALSVSVAAAIAVPKAGAEDAVAVQYHFAGASELSRDANFETATRIFRSPTSADFETLVLNRLSRVFWTSLQFDAGGKPVEVLRPLLDDLLQVESVASFGANQDNLSFVLAARLDKKRAQVWQQSLQKALAGQGTPFTAEGDSGSRWDNGFWMIQTPEWIVVGRGDGLASVRTDYLQQIQKTGRPWPALKDTWLQAVIDWPLLTGGNSPPWMPLKPARTTVDMTASGGRFRITAYLSYPEAVSWTSQPWRIPKDLVREPLMSFTAAQGVEPYLQLDPTFSKLATDPFTNQFICWSQREMPFQSYMAWPVAGAANVLKDLGTKGLALVNPILEGRDHSRLNWVRTASEITWKKSPIMGPFLRVAPGNHGDYLLAGLFLAEETNPSAPDNLWAQFENRSDIVYYNWELTGARVHQWRLLSEIMRLLPPVSGRGKPPAADKKSVPPLIAVENWLSGLEVVLGNTVTEVTRTGPDELTVVRSAPFVFTGLELVWLSHWLADVSSGPVNMTLLPVAKMSGPGVPTH
ncbi:MAG TPA: hypothetical protein VMR33_19710 [Candidatus Baltobacteraceae bacterium]|jgi:hypothetical protein|nr:hypothetical protein [Candidatus Baltobacteraceae bacterium]